MNLKIYLETQNREQALPKTQEQQKTPPETTSDNDRTNEKTKQKQDSYHPHLSANAQQVDCCVLRW